LNSDHFIENFHHFSIVTDIFFTVDFFWRRL